MGIDKRFKEVFYLDENTMLKGMSPKILVEWDSFSHLELYSFLDKSCVVKNKIILI